MSIEPTKYNLKNCYEDTEAYLDKFMDEEIGKEDFVTMACICAIKSCFPNKFMGEEKEPEQRRIGSGSADASGEKMAVAFNEYKDAKSEYQKAKTPEHKANMTKKLTNLIDQSYDGLKAIYKSAETPEEKRIVKDRLVKLVNSF